MKKLNYILLLITFPINIFAAQLTIKPDLVPPFSVYSYYRVIEIDDVVVTEQNKKQFINDVLQSSIDKIITQTNTNETNRIMLFSNWSDDNVALDLGGVEGSLFIPTKNPRVYVLFFNDAKPIENKFIPFTVNLPEVIKGSADFNISLKKNTANLTKSAWVYLNLPKIQEVALQINASKIYVESTTDSDYEEVYLPRLGTPVKISNTNPVLNVKIIQ